MGCATSCVPSRPRARSGRPPLLHADANMDELDRASDVHTRRLHFLRSASSSTSSLATGVYLGFNKPSRKKKPKKRQYNPLAAPSQAATINGMEITKSILGELPEISEVNEAIEKLVKDENETRPIPTLLSPMPMSPGPGRLTRSRFMRKPAGKADDSSDAPSSMVEETPLPTHRRQASNETMFSRLPSVAALSSLGSHKRQTSMDTASTPIGQNIVPSAGMIASPGSVMSTAPSSGGGGHHRRQGSESKMFSRIGRVSSLAGAVDSSDPNHVSSTPATCTTRTFRTFLEKENKEGITDDDLELWRSKVLGVNDERWTVYQMQDYLYSHQNKAQDDKVLMESMDMTRPLSEYFISTSHNTYLFGGQWVTTGGKVDLQMYSRALQKGCRCVEIDVYDGPDGDPIVTHYSSALGGGSVTFLEVCALIAKESFRESRGSSPLILNLENNMSKQTKRAAEILMGAFGSRIVRTDDPVFGWDRVSGVPSAFPTPAALAGRVLCRSKPRDASEEFVALIYFRNSSWRFQNFEDVNRRKFYQTSSLSENRVKGALRKVPGDISPIELNRIFMNRVYPRPTAYASQNFNPLPYWLLGFQLVALNFQTDGVDMDVNRCMFERNGGTGYVLKPSLMRRSMKVQSRINAAGVVARMSSKNGGSLSSSRTLLSRSVLSNGAEVPSPHGGGGGLRATFFASTSSRFASRPFSDNTAVASNQKLESTTNGTKAVSLKKTNHSKSFMGVVEEALTNQEEDVNFDDDDLPPPPPPSLDVGTTSALSPSSTQVPFEPLPKKPNVSSLTTLSLESNASDDSPQVPVQSLQDLDRELTPPYNGLTKSHSVDMDLGQIAVSDATGGSVKSMSEIEEEEKKRRLRARRSSTGSIAKMTLPDETPPSRKRSLEDPGAVPRDRSSPAAQYRMYEEEETEDKVALNSVLIQFLSVKCNIDRTRVNKPNHPPPTTMSQVQGGAYQERQQQRDATTESSMFPDEEVYVELVVDGHNPLDRVEKRTLGTVQLRGTQSSEFADVEEVAAVLKDSESCLFTIRLVDAWEGGNANETVASRSFFAHCILPGTRDLILLGESSTVGYAVPYTVRCKISPMYSIFSRSTGKYELEERISMPASLSCPSKLSMIHCVVVECRTQASKLKVSKIDPFVNVQVIGIPIDSRDLRTPRTSRCIGGKSLPIPKVSSSNPLNGPVSKTSSGNSEFSMGTSQANHGSATSVASDATTPPDVNDSCTWMFPLVMTFAWSEFAFLRFTLRSNVNVDSSTGDIIGAMVTSASRRRGSLLFRSTPLPSPPQDGSVNPSGQTTGTNGSVLDSGFVLGKNMLWADAIRPGYRSIPLYSERNPDTQVGTLLCHFTLFHAKDRTFGPVVNDSTPVQNVAKPTPLLSAQSALAPLSLETTNLTLKQPVFTPDI